MSLVIRPKKTVKRRKPDFSKKAVRKKYSEESEQYAVVEWARYHEKFYPCLVWLHSSLNGVKLGVGQAVKAKRGGMKKGVADLFLPAKSSCKKYCGLYIEMKKRTGSVSISPEQKEFKKFVESEGYYHSFCYGSNQAINLIKQYIGELK